MALLALAGCGEQPAPRRLVIAYPAGPASLIPEEASEEFTWAVLGNVYEALTGLDKAGAPVAVLAETWYNEDDPTRGAGGTSRGGACLRPSPLVPLYRQLDFHVVSRRLRFEPRADRFIPLWTLSYGS